MEKFGLGDFLMSPGTMILRIRHERNIPLSQVAERADISDSQLSRIVNGKCDPKLSTIRKIARALELMEMEE